MTRVQHLIRIHGITTLLLFFVLALPLSPRLLLAQHGHPLVGTWSGQLTGDTQEVRVLLALDFSVDQTLSGFILANGHRLPLTSAVLDPQSWEVILVAQGPDRAGNPVSYEIQGTIENLSSPTERTIAGTWREGGDSGEFRVVLN